MCFFFFSAFKHRDLSLHVYGKKNVCDCLSNAACLLSALHLIQWYISGFFYLSHPPPVFLQRLTKITFLYNE